MNKKYSIVAFLITGFLMMLIIALRFISLKSEKTTQIFHTLQLNTPTLITFQKEKPASNILNREELKINVGSMIIFGDSTKSINQQYPDIILADYYYNNPNDVYMQVFPINGSTSSAVYRFEVYYPSSEMINLAHKSFIELVEKSGISGSQIDTLTVQFIENSDFYKSNFSAITVSEKSNKVLGISETNNESVFRLLLKFLTLFDSSDIDYFNESITPILSSNTPFPTTSKNDQINGLNYNIPIRDTNVIPSTNKRDYIKGRFPASQLQYFDQIIKRSLDEGWNPAFVVTIWVEETGASHYVLKEVGGGGMYYVNEKGQRLIAKGHLGCAPAYKYTMEQSLNCFFRNFNRFKNNQFSDFMYAYSGDDPKKGFVRNPNFPRGVKYYYERLTDVQL